MGENEAAAQLNRLEVQHKQEVGRLQREIANLEKRLGRPRLFRIMDGPDIPWSVIEPCESQAKKNHYQTLERLHERGGLSVCEAVAVLECRKYRKLTDAETVAAKERFASYTRAPAPDLEAVRAILNRMVACDQRERRRVLKVDPAGCDYEIETYDGPFAVDAMKALALLANPDPASPGDQEGREG